MPFSITDVVPDTGGDGRWVSMTVLGAQFHPDAILKLVRPGFAEYEPVEYQVRDSSEIVALFDLRDAPHGLYDVKVVNPGGVEAVVPYRYLVERVIEPDVSIGLGGPRVLAVLMPESVGTYSVVVKSLGNIHTPYTFFQFGVPELGRNASWCARRTRAAVYCLLLQRPRHAGGRRSRGRSLGQPRCGSQYDRLQPWRQVTSSIYPTRASHPKPSSVQVYPGLSELLAQFPDLFTPFDGVTGLGNCVHSSRSWPPLRR